MSDSLPPELDALLDELDTLAAGEIGRNHVAAAIAGGGTYLVTKNAPRSATVGLLTLVALRLGEIDGRLEDMGEMSREERLDAMQRLERQVDPEMRGDDR